MSSRDDDSTAKSYSPSEAASDVTCVEQHELLPNIAVVAQMSKYRKSEKRMDEWRLLSDFIDATVQFRTKF